MERQESMLIQPTIITKVERTPYLGCKTGKLNVTGNRNS